ncbi:MAG: hypothetical protein M1296_02155, partial [Chloroflexi bacterium]|nr:hypothetical protein [Chloroflexota bacterium]
SSAACLGHTRRSIARYRAWTQEQGLLQQEVAAEAEVHRLLAKMRRFHLHPHRYLADLERRWLSLPGGP